MSSLRNRRSRALVRLLVLAVPLALGLFTSPTDAQFEDSWEEKAQPADGSNSPTPGGGSPTPGAAPEPTKPPPPVPTPIPTPDPKKLSRDDYACQKLKLKENELVAAIENKRQGPNPSSSPALPGEKEYEAAYNAAVDELKKDPNKKPPATDKELDEAGKKAGREAVEKALQGGTIVDPNTGESYGDVYRREWDGSKRGTPVPPPSDKVPPGASQYMKDCAAAGVPLPPPWGDPRWVNQGELPDKNNFAGGTNRYTEVWVSRSPAGICYALPRRVANDKDPIQLLGQICQSTATGKACFWDNIGLDGKRIEGSATNGLDPSKLQGGDKLEENCTNCHRGDNVFIIHPGTPLEQPGSNPCGGGASPADQNSGKPYKPLGRPSKAGDGGFQNPPRTTPLPSGQGNGCTMCHSIPTPTKEYCGLLKAFVERGEMPPGGKPDADEQKDIDQLKKDCNKLLPAARQWK